MAVLLLASTTSWAIGKHYCMGRLMNISFFEHAEDCGMNMVSENEGSLQLEASNPCCIDEIVLVQGQDDLRISFDDIRVDHQIFLISFAQNHYFLFSEFNGDLVPHELYPPPLLVKDIQLLDEVFLI